VVHSTLVVLVVAAEAEATGMETQYVEKPETGIVTAPCPDATTTFPPTVGNMPLGPIIRPLESKARMYVPPTLSGLNPEKVMLRYWPVGIFPIPP